MKIALACVVFILGACASSYSQSQGEMNMMAGADFEKADAALNKAYKKIFASLEDEQSKKLFQESQRAWLAYRDAQAAFYADIIARRGTMRPQIYNMTRTDLTEKRIAEMKKSMAVR